ncbi:MAG: hypothetical protein P8Q97_03050 [Myxococcota bacterium]|jgi:hypothetical protein|nr:hypothetical protein [Myxococcota bacterium]
MRPTRDRTRSRLRSSRWAAWPALVLVATLLGCVTSSPDGTRFVAATPPGSGESLVYVYRSEPLRGIGAFDLRLDADELGPLAKGQYLSLVVAPGRHDLSARLRWMGIIPRSWNSLAFTAGPGQTLYLRVSAGYANHPTPASSPREDSGGQPTGGVTVILSQPGAEKALGELQSMRRVGST